MRRRGGGGGGGGGAAALDVPGVAISRLKSSWKCGGLYLVVTEVVPVVGSADEKDVLALLCIWVTDWEGFGVQVFFSIYDVL